MEDAKGSFATAVALGGSVTARVAHKLLGAAEADAIRIPSMRGGSIAARQAAMREARLMAEAGKRGRVVFAIAGAFAAGYAARSAINCAVDPNSYLKFYAAELP